MSSAAEFTITMFGLTFIALAVAAIGIWHDRKKEAQRELDALNAEYKQVILDEYRKRHTFDGELPDHEPR